MNHDETEDKMIITEGSCERIDDGVMICFINDGAMTCFFY